MDKDFTQGKFGLIYIGLPMKPVILDIGCGIHQKGNVNIDIVKKNRFTNFIQADCHNLPIKDKGVDSVLCHHLIEHINNPFKLMEELIRVAKIVIEIRTPYRFSYTAKSDRSHKHSFNLTWFKRIAHKHNMQFHGFVRLDIDRPLIHRLKGLIPIGIFPLELFMMIFPQNKPKGFEFHYGVF